MEQWKKIVTPLNTKAHNRFANLPSISISKSTTISDELGQYLATSVDIEQVFSKGHLILSHIWNHLSVESTRALMCLGYWSRLGYVEDSDIHVAAILLDVMEKDVDDEEDMW